MKVKCFKIILLALTIFMAIGISACFSPLGYKGDGDTSISIRLGGGGAMARSAVDPEALQYTLTFSGPGNRRVTESAGWGETVVAKVVPGRWSISVRAFDPADPNITRAVGEAYSIDVRAGAQNNVDIKMAVYWEVGSWAELETAIATGEYDAFIAVTAPFDAGAMITTAAPGNPDRIFTLTSLGGPHTISRTATGSLFTVGADTELILRDITLEGSTGNNAPLLRVNPDGKLTLRNGGRVTGNTYTTSVEHSGGAGIFMDGGNLEIAGGEILNNTLNNSSATHTWGGGIYAINSSSVLMTGGSISGNKITSILSIPNNNGGGGIALINSCYFEMIDGVIENNSVYSENTSGGLSAGASGGGVYIDLWQNNTNSSFYLRGGKIRNNVCSSKDAASYGFNAGGGVAIRGAFYMSGGIISGNSISSSVNPNPSYQTNQDGSYGGGVGILAHVSSTSIFEKTGGVIYGNDVEGYDNDNIPLKNTAHNDTDGWGCGHAVFFGNDVYGYAQKPRRNVTAWENDDLDGSIIGLDGGWELAP